MSNIEYVTEEEWKELTHKDRVPLDKPLDYISRKAAIEEFSCCELTPDGGIDANYAIDFLEQIPSADVVEVVRCKDCKHCEHWYRDKGRCFLWVEDGIDVFEDGFCNYGGRREDG